MNGSEQGLKVLDCTLRDGGYYTDWDYDVDLARKYLRAVEEAGVDILELGFRMPPAAEFRGAFAYTTDYWIETLGIPESITLGVMCNASDLVRDGDPAAAVDALFSPAASSRVELVRIAAHFREVHACEPAVRRLAELGYRVGFNLMQAGGRPADEVRAKAAEMVDWPLEVLYFADSIGNMGPADVAGTVAILREVWPGEIGFHAHNNMGRGLDNALSAIEAGATWIDATVLGMGRGAGNACLEYLLLELHERGVRQSRLDLLLALVLEEFGELQAHHGWGPNLFYHLSALYNVHPTYVQEMLSDDRYSRREIASALQRLGALGASGFSEQRLHEAMRGADVSVDGSWSPGDLLEGRTVVIVGPGEAGARHRDGVLALLEQIDPFVMCLNSNSWLPDDRIDAWVACNPERLTLDADYYRARRGRLVVPRALVPEVVEPALEGFEILDYGIRNEAGRFAAEPTLAVVPAPLVVLYALALADAGGAGRILLVGIDGYDGQDPRHREMETVLEVYRDSGSRIEPVAVTPTTLSVRRSSVYAPELVP